jgi:FixJ family two-component response regulator
MLKRTRKNAAERDTRMMLMLVWGFTTFEVAREYGVSQTTVVRVRRTMMRRAERDVLLARWKLLWTERARVAA